MSHYTIEYVLDQLMSPHHTIEYVLDQLMSPHHTIEYGLDQPMSPHHRKEYVLNQPMSPYCTIEYVLDQMNPESSKLNHLKFHPLKVVSRYRDSQLQVGDNYSYLFNLTPSICKTD